MVMLVFFFAEDYSPFSYENLFTWEPAAYVDNTNEMWEGDLSVTFKDDTVPPQGPQQICYDPVYGYAYLYPVLDGLCSEQGTDYVFFSAPYVGDVCEEIDDVAVTAIIDAEARCEIGNGCGTDTGSAPAGSTDSGTSALTISFSFLVSLLAIYYFSN